MPWRFHLKTLNSALIPLILLAAGAASAQTVSVSPFSLTCSGLSGGSSVPQNLSVLASGGNAQVAVLPSQSWLTVSPSVATTPQQFTVTANPAGLTPGVYQDANFRVIGPNNTVTVPVTFTVSSIAVTPQSLSFAYTAGANVNPLSQNL